MNKSKEPKEPKEAKNGIYKNFIWGLIILMLISAAYSFVSDRFHEKKIIPLSELVQKINAGEVNQITIIDLTLDVKLKNGDSVEVQKEPDVGLTDTLHNYSVNPDALKNITISVESRSGLNLIFGLLLPILGPILLIGFFIWFTARQIQRGSMQAFTFGQSKARLITPNTQRVRTTFKDIAGADEAKEELTEVVDFLKNPKKFLDMGAKIPKGVLLMGAPGTGKSLLARAVAGEAGVPFFHMSGSEFIEMFVGVGASRVRDTFRIAKKAAPAIIFIDEIDAVGRMRGAGLGGGHDEREQTLNQLLVEMDGMETDDRVIIIAATNRPDVLDPALLRPGRFDRRVVIDLPDKMARKAILEIHARNKPLDEDVNLQRIAQRTPGFSGADLENLMNEAAILTVRQDRKKITQLDLVNSIDKVLLGPERKNRLLSEKEKEITAYHEGGHAVVAASMPYTDPVHKITIVSRGRAGGYTLKLPSEDRYFHSRSQFISDLAVALGGYAAEKLIFNELTTGASDDLEKATRVARNIVMRFGMSEKLGPVSLGEKDELIFLGKDLGTERNYSDDTARLIDGEVKRLLDEANETAKRILTEKRNKLEEVAKVLMEKETIEREEFEDMMGIPHEKKELDKI